MNPQSISETHSTRTTHAIVIGGSVAGLLAARVLADHFDRVTVIKRDHLPENAEARKGVPQGYHLHILLARGRQILDQLFPGLFDELNVTGAGPIDLMDDAAFLIRTGWLARFQSGIMSYASSRVLLEWSIQKRLAANPKIHFMEGAQVNHLLTNEAKTQVTGVQVRFRPGADSDGEQPLFADLVVDASGRGSNAPDWLSSLGYERPQETIINSFLGYSTRWYRPPADFTGQWRLLFIGARPPEIPRGGGIFVVENGQWVVTIAGAARDYPPTDEAGFMDFAHSLISPALYEAIKDAEPISPIYGYQRTANQLRHYERLSRWPEHFVILGDAVCAFNPIYGQGMSAAAMGALVLDESLRAGQRVGVTQRIQKKLAEMNEDPWLLATGEDFRYPTTEGGQRTLMTRFTHWYIDRVTLAMPDSTEISRTFQAVAQLIEPPSALFAPAVMGPALRHALKRNKPSIREELPAYWQTEQKVSTF